MTKNKFQSALSYLGSKIRRGCVFLTNNTLLFDVQLYFLTASA